MFKAARRIVERLRQNGHTAYFAGGWVRDYLLGRRAADIDIATSACPKQVMHLFPHSTPLGMRFGVVQVRFYGRPFEVTTFRKEGPYLDGRHPSSVDFAESREDALRRDFTINGLFFDPADGEVIDFVGGTQDLERRVIRTIGDPRERFSEDRLRMLRAVRFACLLGFSIAEETWRAIIEQSGTILQVSPERIRDEVAKTLTGPSPGRGLDLWQRSGLLARILPEVEAMRGVPQPPEFHPEGDVFEHTQLALGFLRRPSAVLALGTLLHDVGKPPTLSVQERIRFDGHVETGARIAGEICRRLRLSNQDTERVVDLVRCHLHFMNVMEMRESTLRRFLGKPDIADHLALHRADCLGSHRDLGYYRFCQEKLREWRAEPARRPALINGNDLMAAGYQPGPRFGEILQEVEDLQLEGVLSTREQALEFVRSRYRTPEGTPRSDDEPV
jgi:putative nucleotidyltransferase with HDIG domain